MQLNEAIEELKEHGYIVESKNEDAKILINEIKRILKNLLDDYFEDSYYIEDSTGKALMNKNKTWLMLNYRDNRFETNGGASSVDIKGNKLTFYHINKGTNKVFDITMPDIEYKIAVLMYNAFLDTMANNILIHKNKGEFSK